MSLTKSPLRSVSAQTRRRSTHDKAAGSDGDLRHDQAAEPSTGGIESNATSEEELRLRLNKKDIEGHKLVWPCWDYPEDPDDWDYAYERLASVIQHARAIAAAQHALAYWYNEGLGWNGTPPDSANLAEVGVKTCDEALYLAGVLRGAACTWKARLLDLAIPDRKALDPIQEMKARAKVEAAYREKKKRAEGGL